MVPSIVEARNAMRLALAQVNSVVGDIDGNATRVVEWLEGAKRSGAAASPMGSGWTLTPPSGTSCSPRPRRPPGRLTTSGEMVPRDAAAR